MRRKLPRRRFIVLSRRTSYFIGWTTGACCSLTTSAAGAVGVFFT
jgi:hypothetical protein